MVLGVGTRFWVLGVLGITGAQNELEQNEQEHRVEKTSKTIWFCCSTGRAQPGCAARGPKACIAAEAPAGVGSGASTLPLQNQRQEIVLEQLHSFLATWGSRGELREVDQRGQTSHMLGLIQPQSSSCLSRCCRVKLEPFNKAMNCRSDLCLAVSPSPSQQRAPVPVTLQQHCSEFSYLCKQLGTEVWNSRGLRDRLGRNPPEGENEFLAAIPIPIPYYLATPPLPGGHRGDLRTLLYLSQQLTPHP
ncbi:hypothetical protein DV515_00013020 [Chloebia gouldiae]|uniref:Uncharacterized protein n=1 Tax=Chloebia gouldiae TaxID=44316 RepID=A0A3L8S209_CHLGU|nr:hypothetical protein DV515_00013020 [Chloebia gouldiae]